MYPVIFPYPFSDSEKNSLQYKFPNGRNLTKTYIIGSHSQISGALAIANEPKSQLLLRGKGAGVLAGSAREIERQRGRVTRSTFKNPAKTAVRITNCKLGDGILSAP